MRKILLLTVLLLGTAGLRAQSKATATVNLMTGMTAKLDLNNATTTATLTLTGPSDRYIALQIGSFATGGGMQDGTDVVYWNGTTLVDASHTGIGGTPNIDTVNDWTVTSNTIAGTTRTIVATRAFNTGSTDDYTIVYTDPNIDFAYARSSIASTSITSGHAANRGYSLNNAFTCVAPAAPTASAQAFCAGATVANLVATGAAGATFKWYAAATGGAALAGTTVLANGVTYYASQTVGDCESTTRTGAVATVTTVPLPGTPDTTPEFCSETTIAGLTVTGQAGAVFNWYSVPTGGTALPTTTVLAAGSYYVSQTVGACTSARLQITVSFFTVPMPTIADTTPEFCSESTISDLVATGQAGATINWYENATGGAPLAGTTVLAAGNYFVSQTVGTCTSARLEVTVSYITLPNPNVPDETPTVCPGTTIANLTVTGQAGAVFKWYAAATGGEPLAGTTMLVTGTNYYVSQTVGDCVSNRREVTVTIDALPIPEAEHNQALCQGSTIDDLEAGGLEGAVFTWHKPQDSPALGEDVVLVEGPYYVKQTVNGCTSEVKEVVVTLLPLPAMPGGVSVQQFEAGETVSDFLISVLIGATINWYIMDGDNLEAIPATTELEDGVDYYVTQTVDGCESEPLKITADEILGTPSFDLKNLAVYPNPVIDVLTISNKEIISEVAVMNLLGQTVILQKAGSEKVEINTSKLQSGTYILKVSTPNGSASLKIVK